MFLRPNVSFGAGETKEKGKNEKKKGKLRIKSSKEC